MDFEFTSVGRRTALLAGLLIVVALAVGYATAGGSDENTASPAPALLKPVRVQPSGDVTLAKLQPTSRLQPASRRTPSVATRTPAATQQTPAVQQPLTPTPTPQTQTPKPSTGGTKTFDSSG